MPAGVPVGTLAIGKAGAINAALLAASVLALAMPALAKRLDAWRATPDRRRRRAPEGRGRDELSAVLGPARTIGILGGGQLGRMLALAAARLGSSATSSPEPDAAPSTWCTRVTCADYADKAALDRFAADVDVVTYEFENVPAQTATFLARAHAGAARPARAGDDSGPADRKEFHRALGIPTAPFAPVDGATQLAEALERSAGRRCSRRGASATTARARRRSRNGGDRAAAWRSRRTALPSSKPSCRSSAKSRSSRRAARDGRSNAST